MLNFFVNQLFNFSFCACNIVELVPVPVHLCQTTIQAFQLMMIVYMLRVCNFEVQILKLMVLSSCIPRLF